MMSINGCAKAWKKVCNCYDETRDENNPCVTMQKIVDELGMEQTREVFATVAKIKEHDGRISAYNRKQLENVVVNPECLINGNPIMYAGLDHIHTAHIDNLITELVKILNNA